MLTGAEIRRLLSRLRFLPQERLAEIEDRLRSQEGPAYVGSASSELLQYFGEYGMRLLAANQVWILRVLPHAHLRMVQRGIQPAHLETVFRRWVETMEAAGELLIVGRYRVSARLRRGPKVHFRFDVEEAQTTGGRARLVTVFTGTAFDEESINISL
jgi:hypothetical protein